MSQNGHGSKSGEEEGGNDGGDHEEEDGDEGALMSQGPGREVLRGTPWLGFSSLD